MSRRNPLPGDAIAEPVGDRVLLGVNEFIEAGKLPPGICSSATNKRFDDGQADTRLGLLALPPQDVGATILGYTLFTNPEGYEAWVLATASAVYVVRDGMVPGTVPLPSGTTLSGNVWLVQAFEKVFLFREGELPVLEWDGTESGEFEEIEQTASGSSTGTIPNGEIATYLADRLFVAYTEGTRLDSIAVSDQQDYTRYAAQLNAFRANFGTADDVEALLPYGQATIIIAKGQSMLYVSNVKGDLTDAFQGEITRERGLMARRAISQVGDEVWFLSNGGLYALVPDTNQFMRLAKDPVSSSLPKSFARINWRAASGAVSSTDAQRYYLAVPIDNATRNNAVFVYHLINRQWEGVHTFAPEVDFIGLGNALYLGERRMWFIDRTGQMGPYAINLGSDRWDDTEHAISDEVITRGYAAGADRRRFLGAKVTLSTWNPTVTVKVLTDGFGEEATLASAKTRSRTAYVTTRGAYTVTNVNGDHDEPWREDYSVPSDDTGFYAETGLDLEARSTWQLRAKPGRRAHHMRLKIANTTGACAVREVQLESTEADRARRTQE